MLGDSVRRRQPKRRMSSGGSESRASGSRGSAGRGWRQSWKRPLLYLAGALLLPLLAGYLIAVFVLFPPTEVAGSGIPMPDLVGLTTSEAQRELVAASLGEMELTEFPHPEAPAGRILAQSPLAGQQLRAGAGVRVAVSAGPARVMVPDVLGFGADRAETMMRRAGFNVERAVQESPAAEGRVIRTDPEPGQARTLPAMVTLIVSAGPPAEPDSLVLPEIMPDTSLLRR